MADRILTKHPDPKKQGVRIDRTKYDAVKSAIVSALETGGEMTFLSLRDAVNQQLRGKFEGSISWYYTTVKLDLEARSVVQRVQGSRPQRVRLKSHS